MLTPAARSERRGRAPEPARGAIRAVVKAIARFGFHLDVVGGIRPLAPSRCHRKRNSGGSWLPVAGKPEKD